MKKSLSVIIVLLAGALVMASCGQTTPPAPGVTELPRATAKPGGQITGAGDWEQRWEQKLQAAKKEGKLVFYSVFNPQSRIAVGKAFKEKFGIEIEFVLGSGNELPRKLENERRAGLKLADVYNSGYSMLTLVKPTGALEPLAPHLILPEVLDGKVWIGGKAPYLDKDGQIFTTLAGANYHLVINTDMVKEGQIKSYADLLKPEWEGKILMFDPTIGGGGNEWISTMLLNVMGMEKGKEFMLQFARQKPVIIRDTRLTAEWVAKGKYPLVIGGYKQGISEFQDAGAPLKYQKTIEGGVVGYSGGMLGKVEGGPNPNAATVFINWLLAKEGQTIYAKNYGFPSARTDVPTEGLDPTLVPVPGEKLLLVDEEWFLERDKLTPLIREIFRGLLP